MPQQQSAASEYQPSRRNWRWKREAIVTPVESIEVIALRRVRAEIVGAPDGCFRFFEMIFARANRTDRGKTIAAAFGIPCSTLNARFFRAGLQSPRAYARAATFVSLASILDDPTISFARAAMEIEAGSSQTTQRSLRTFFDLTPNEFRRAHSGPSMLERFCTELVLPYTEQLRRFDPAAPVDVRKRRLRRAS